MWYASLVLVESLSQLFWKPKFLCFIIPESAKSEIDALAEAERELMMIEKDLHAAEGVHFFLSAYLFLH